MSKGLNGRKEVGLVFKLKSLIKNYNFWTSTQLIKKLLKVSKLEKFTKQLKAALTESKAENVYKLCEKVENRIKK